MAGIDYAFNISPEIAAHYERRLAVETKIIHRASTRGHLNEGWLESYQTFSYAGFHNPERIRFGALCVLNENIVAPGMGFPSLHRDNMEIVTLPLEGTLEHRDSLGSNTVVRKGEIQVMSTGTGIKFQQHNHHRDRLAKFLQLWFYPDRKNTAPRSAHVRLDTGDMVNNLSLIVSPRGGGAAAWVDQQAWVHTGRLDRGYEYRHRVRSRRNGVYLFLIRGEAGVNGEELRSHDSIGLWDTRCIDIRASVPSEMVLMEVPMR